MITLIILSLILFVIIGAIITLQYYHIPYMMDFYVKAQSHKYDITFPEHLVKNTNIYDYDKRVKEGLIRMKTQDVIFTGLAHNVEHVIQLTLDRLHYIGKHFKSYKIVIYENNSTDGTKNILSQDTNIIVKSEDLPQTGSAIDSDNRFEMMAQYRNECHVLISHITDPYDQVIVVDLDLQGGISLEGLAHSYSFDNWDMIACNGLCMKFGFYYDKIAYKSDDGKRCKGFSLSGSSHVTDTRYISFTKGDELIPVKSAFGGAAIYTKDAFLSSTYDGYDCEHLCFNESLMSQGFNKLFLNPSFIVLR